MAIIACGLYPLMVINKKIVLSGLDLEGNSGLKDLVSVCKSINSRKKKLLNICKLNF